MLGEHGAVRARQNRRVMKTRPSLLSQRPLLRRPPLHRPIVRAQMPRDRMTRVQMSSSRGFTLIEVLVALIVLVLGVLGSAAMMLTSLRDNKQSALRSQAAAMAYELGDLMRANPGMVSTFTGSTTPAFVAACYTSGCAQSDMASSDYNQWIAKLTAVTPVGATTPTPVPGLPNASWKICFDATNPSSMSTCDGLATSPLVVKLKWDEKFNNGTFVADSVNSGNSDRPNLVVPMRPY